MSLRPKVFEYIRSSRFDPVKVARLTSKLAEYAEGEDLALAYVFTDNGVSSTALVRPGFSVLLDSLARPDAYGVVIPAVHHLSWNPEVRKRLAERIRGAGAVLYVIASADSRSENLGDEQSGETGL